jgi:hypothetical protein
VSTGVNRRQVRDGRITAIELLRRIAYSQSSTTYDAGNYAGWKTSLVCLSHDFPASCSPPCRTQQTPNPDEQQETTLLATALKWPSNGHITTDHWCDAAQDAADCHRRVNSVRPLKFQREARLNDADTATTVRSNDREQTARGLPGL